jgi:hypothetical protein
MHLTLTVSHNIFLNSEQRYELHIGKEVKVVGVSSPVWVHNKTTSEPAHEIFCNYTITPTDFKLYIRHNAKGYDILLPRSTYDPEDKRENPTILNNLINFKDGGVEWLAFRQFNTVKKNKKDITIAHFVEMKDMVELTKTLHI